MVLAPLVATLIAASTLPDSTTQIHAVRLTMPVLVDGILSEEVWHSAPPCSTFHQLDPVEGAAPSQRTEVRVAYDDDAIYIGARLYDTAPDSIMARLTRRDVEVPADRFAVYLDPYHDRRSGYYFRVNAAGTLYDGTMYNDGWMDDSWDAVWTARAKRDDQGWTAEMKIPLSQLRYQHGGDPVWGINFSRSIQRRSEGVYLVYTPKKESGFVSRFPDLVGLSSLHQSRSIEVIPYVTSKQEFLNTSPNDPFNDGSRTTNAAGGDLRMSVGSRLTLNATVNPDFGQVEVDPAVVNLSDVETFYPEKRPFFVEGSQIFHFGNEGADNYWGFNWPEPVFFYSRRIGRAPQSGAPDSDYTDVPDGTTIVGAGKLIGKLSPTWNFGTLMAVTAKEEADLFGNASGTTTQAPVEPLTYWGVARAQKEFKKRQYGLGFMANGAVRDFEDGTLQDNYNRASLMSGIDGWAFLDAKQTWVLSGWSVMSHIEGTKSHITDVQQSSRHYFQRPDADYLGVDPDATSLTGFGTRLWLNKQKGRWFSNSALGFISPKFDVNDVGFMSRADVINGHAGLGYKWTDVTKMRKYQNVLGAVFGSFDFQGNRVWSGLFAEGETEFINNWSWNYHVAYNPQNVSNRGTRGGPLMITPAGYELGTYFDTDSKQKLFFFVESGMYQQPSITSWNMYLYPGVEWKPISNLTLRVGPGLEKVTEEAQYVVTSADPFATSTYGSRYVFATLDQSQVSANIRLNVAFTPTVSLQVYAQPLIASGDYHGYKELAQPKSFDFLVYGRNGSTFDEATGVADPDGPGPAPAVPIYGLNGGNPDFNFKSLRGNAVFRWEYRPGSTFFLVWTQQRVDEEEAGDLNFNHSMHRLFSQQPEDIFLAKLTWYLGL